MKTQFKIEGRVPFSDKFEAELNKDGTIGISVVSMCYESAYVEFTRSEIEQIVQGLIEILEGMK